MRIFKLGLVLGLLLFMVSCSSKKLNIPEELRDAPSWVLNPYVEGAMSAVGSAIPNAGNDFSFQRQEAVADARDNLARQMSVKVNNMFKSYKGATGSGEDATFDKSSENVSKQIASQSLVGSKVSQVWISPNGTMYILIALNSDLVIEEMEKAAKTSFRNEKAMYQKFIADKAQGELAKELEAYKKDETPDASNSN